MKVYCKGGPNTLTKGRIYDVISGSFEDGGFIIKDDFDNTQLYYSEYFLSIKDGRDILLDTILNEAAERKISKIKKIHSVVSTLLDVLN